MKILNYFLLVLAACGTLIGCEKEQLSPKAKLVYQIDGEVAALLHKKYEMKLASVGIGTTREKKINSLVLSFELNKVLNKNEIRGLLVECTQTYLEAINNNSELQPYLVETPFSNKYLEIALFFSDNGIEPIYPKICCVKLFRSTVFYRTINPKKKTGGYFTEEKESYEEALRIINEK